MSRGWLAALMLAAACQEPFDEQGPMSGSLRQAPREEPATAPADHVVPGRPAAFVKQARAWLRGFAPQRYRNLTDDELWCLEKIELHRTPTTGNLDLLAAFPKLTHLKIWDDGEFRARTLQPPAGQLDDPALDRISMLRGLRSLVIGGWNVKYTDAGLECLRELPHLAHLDLCQAQQITDKGMAALIGIRLESLDITYTRITDVGLEHLLKIPTLVEVKYGWAAESRRWLARFQAKHPNRPFLK